MTLLNPAPATPTTYHDSSHAQAQAGMSSTEESFHAGAQLSFGGGVGIAASQEYKYTLETGV
jgi:hypothetical protein